MKKIDQSLPLKDIKDIKKPRSYVFYGRSGTGKTTISSTFPKPLLLLDINDQGTDSIADIKDIKVMEVSQWSDVEDVYWWLQKNPNEFKTVVIDTVTQMQGLAIEKVMANNKKDAAKSGDWGSMSRREWGDVAQLMKTWVVNFRNLPMEVIFLAQERVFNIDEDNDTNVDENLLMPEVGPRLSPSVASTLNAAVSVICNTFCRIREYEKEIKGKKVIKRNTEYCLRVGPNPVYITKLRKPKSVMPPSVIVDATYEDIIEAIRGE